MKDKLLLAAAGLLIVFSLSSSNFSLPNWINTRPSVVDSVVIPSISEDNQLLVNPIVESFLNGSADRTLDAKRLASLYMDLSTLIELDGEDLVVKNTEDVRQANSLSGVMLRLNIKDKYPNLSKNCNEYLTSVLGEDVVELDENLRQKASNAFINLAWACNEGSK